MKDTQTVSNDTFELALDALEATIDYIPDNDVQGDRDSGLAFNAIAALKRAIEDSTKEAINQQGESQSATDAIYAAWHGVGIDILGGNWTRFVGMLPPLYTSAPIKQQGDPVLWVDPKTAETSYIKPLRSTYIPLYREAPTIPEGWQLVQKEPTPEMLRFAEICVPKTPAAQYRAMLSAAPEYKGEE